MKYRRSAVYSIICLVSTIPLPFRRSVLPLYRCHSSVPQLPLPLQVRTEMLETSFRIHRDEVTRTLIDCPPTAERQKQDSILFATVRQLRCNGRCERQRRNRIFYIGDVILTALTEFLWNLRNDNSETATEWWKLGNCLSSPWVTQQPSGQRARLTIVSSSPAGHRRSRSNRGPVAVCTLGLGLLNPPSSLGW